jgi:hypothetical protein
MRQVGVCRDGEHLRLIEHQQELAIGAIKASQKLGKCKCASLLIIEELRFHRPLRSSDKV